MARKSTKKSEETAEKKETKKTTTKKTAAKKTATKIIEGLPGVLTVRAGEIIEVTPEQLEQLIELQFVESEEQVSNRKAIEKGLEPQHPERLSYDIMATNRDFNIKPRELEKLYTDKLIVVD